MAPGKVGRISMAFEGDSTVIAASAIRPPIRVTNDGAPVSSPRFRLSSSDTSILAIEGGSIIGRRLGVATLTATLESSLLPADGPKLTQNIRVVPKAITVTPSVVRFQAIGDTLSLSVVATDAKGDTIPNAPLSWKSGDTTIVHVSGAKLTAMRADSTDVRAAVGGDSVRIPVIVTQRVASYAFPAPVMVLDAIGADTQLVVTARDANGNAIPNAPPPIWEISDTTHALVSASGVLHAVSNADASTKVYVRARRATGADSMLVVVDQVATRVVITPVNGVVISSLGARIRMTAAAYDRLGQIVTDGAPHWVSRQPNLASFDISQGPSVFVTGLATGTARIVARTDAAADSVDVRVLNEPASIVVSPDSTLLGSAGDTIGLRARVFNGLGDSIPGASVSWQTPDAGVVRVLPNGGVVALDSGRARVIGQITTSSGRQLADTAIVAVTNQPVLVRMLVPIDTLIYLGDTVTVPVRIENARGGALARTRVRWSASNPLIATTDAAGRVTAKAVGTTWIIAAGDPGARDSMQVVVTNDAASITIDAHAAGAIDTMPQPGTSLAYTATVRNAAGATVSGFTKSWSSSAPTVATVGQDGVVYATGYGTTLITVQAANVSDTVRIVVHHPSRIRIDQARATSPAFGTLARPLGTIGAGVAMAQPGDTLWIAPNGTYMERLAIASTLFIAGDSSAFLAGGRNPTTLPQLVNSTTAPAIAANGGTLTVSHLVIRNGASGAAISTTSSDVAINAVYVNPGSAATPRGSGIVVAGAPSTVMIDSTRVEGTVGNAIRITGSTGVRVTKNVVMTVARAGTGTLDDGAGIAVSGGTAPFVSANTIRTADGVAILIDGAANASVTANILRGERQLMLVNAASGLTSVSGNSFDLARPIDDPYTGNSTTDGRSGLEVRASSGVQVTGNSFHDAAGPTSLMDAIHLADARAAKLDQNRVIGGRRAVRSERSSWNMLRSRADSTALAIQASGGDTLSLTDDTLAAAGTGCIGARSSELTLTRVVAAQCGVGDMPAIALISGALTTDLLTISGTNPRAIVVDSARRATLRRTTVRGPNAATVGVAGNGGVEITADSAIVTNNIVTGYADRAGIWLSGGVVRADSNSVNRSRTGIAVARAATSLDIRDDDLYDADTAALKVTSATPVNAPGIWWGDGRGPRGTSTTTAGDTAVGPVITTPYRGAPLRNGVTATRMKKVRGDNQFGFQFTSLPLPLTVRITDADGLPVANKTVTFALSGASRSTLNGGSKSVNVITNSSGLAEVTLNLGRNPSDNTVTVTSPGVTDTAIFSSIAF